MRIDISKTEHRPWSIPTTPWIMTQRWHDLLFAHWPIPIDEMRAVVPPQLELDIYDNQAWVGLVPFRMSNVRPRYVPAVPWLSSFPEYNVRTYVRSSDPDNPKPGVYFFSLEAGNPVAVSIARNVFKLPYFRADMNLDDDGTTIRYRTKRTHLGAAEAEFVGRYVPTGDVAYSQAGTLDHWLTERYCLYTVGHGSAVYRAEIHHEQWPLQAAELEIEVNTMAAASGLTLPDGPPLLHFSRSLDVVVWPLQRIYSNRSLKPRIFQIGLHW
ncbi:MAG: DUF2071 domain-containing protein [Chloroflexota bacterium]